MSEPATGTHHRTAAATPPHPRQETTTMNRERVIYVLVGIALGMYVVPRVRAKIGF